jgi:hypothetical protein
MGNNQNGSKSIKKNITLVLVTGLIGFFIGLLGDFVKIAVTDLKNYNAVKIETEKEFSNNNVKVKFVIYKLGNNPSSFDFDFATEEGIHIASKPEVRQISKSVLYYGEVRFKDDKIEDDNFALYIQDMHKYDQFEVVVALSANDTAILTDPPYKLNVKTKDPSERALEAGFFDFLFKWPVYVTAIIIAIILLFVISLISYFLIGALLNGAKGETIEVGETNEEGKTNEMEE